MKNPEDMTYQERLKILQARYYKTWSPDYIGADKARMRRDMPRRVCPGTEQERVYRSGRW